MDITSVSTELPVLIAGPTASGKSALAMEIAARGGGVIVNADAIQVYGGWRILTARPSVEDEAALPHVLYGHVPPDQSYSVGQWLRELAPLLGGVRPIIIGGTGLYFTALTEGLAEIPPVAPEIRAQADQLSLETLRAGIAAQTAARLDLLNRARVQRAWEVEAATGRPLHAWQDDTPAPLLAPELVQRFVVNAPPELLNPRIERRFDMMVAAGLLEEGQKMQPSFLPTHPASKAIGADALIAHLRGEMSREDLRDAVVIGTRQYAKRQRSWFRARMRDWQPVQAAAI